MSLIISSPGLLASLSLSKPHLLYSGAYSICLSSSSELNVFQVLMLLSSAVTILPYWRSHFLFLSVRMLAGRSFFCTHLRLVLRIQTLLNHTHVMIFLFGNKLIFFEIAIVFVHEICVLFRCRSMSVYCIVSYSVNVMHQCFPYLVLCILHPASQKVIQCF